MDTMYLISNKSLGLKTLGISLQKDSESMLPCHPMQTYLPPNLLSMLA